MARCRRHRAMVDGRVVDRGACCLLIAAVVMNVDEKMRARKGVAIGVLPRELTARKLKNKKIS
jgi:hypothetical protein